MAARGAQKTNRGKSMVHCLNMRARNNKMKREVTVRTCAIISRRDAGNRETFARRGRRSFFVMRQDEVGLVGQGVESDWIWNPCYRNP